MKIIDEQSPVPKYHQLKEYLRQEINSGNLKLGDRIPTEMELVDRCRMNRLTVRQAIMDLVKEGVLYRRRGLGTFVVEPRLPQPETLVKVQKAKTVGLLLQYIINISDHYFSTIATGIGSALRQCGYSLQLGCTTADEEELAALQGVIILDHIMPQEKIRAMAEMVPVVLVDREVEHPNVVCVSVDNYLGIRLATEYMIELGHQRLALFAGEFQFHYKQQRMVRAFLDTLRAHGMPFDDCSIEELTSGDMEYVTLRLMNVLSRVSPTGLLCANDKVACQLLKTLNETGYRVPADISVMGYNDEAMASLMSPPLTTVRAPIEQLGRESGKAIVHLISGTHKRIEMLKPELVIRKSTAPPGSGP